MTKQQQKRAQYIDWAGVATDHWYVTDDSKFNTRHARIYRCVSRCGIECWVDASQLAAGVSATCGRCSALADDGPPAPPADREAAAAAWAFPLDARDKSALTAGPQADWDVRGRTLLARLVKEAGLSEFMGWRVTVSRPRRRPRGAALAHVRSLEMGRRRAHLQLCPEGSSYSYDVDLVLGTAVGAPDALRALAPAAARLRYIPSKPAPAPAPATTPAAAVEAPAPVPAEAEETEVAQDPPAAPPDAQPQPPAPEETPITVARLVAVRATVDAMIDRMTQAAQAGELRAESRARLEQARAEVDRLAALAAGAASDYNRERDAAAFVEKLVADLEAQLEKARLQLAGFSDRLTKLWDAAERVHAELDGARAAAADAEEADREVEELEKEEAHPLPGADLAAIHAALALFEQVIQTRKGAKP